MKTWRERIAEARARGKFTAQDVSDAGGRPRAPYAMCAVGEQADTYDPGLFFAHHENSGSTREDRCGVMDSLLMDLGGDFYGAVVSDDFDTAESILGSVEDRALDLKRQAAA